MQYPLELSFKVLALASQIYIRDSKGELVGYVKQKLLKLKEDIRIYADEAQTRELYSIKANKVIDFSARYNFADASGREFGAVARKGMKSLWKAHYDIYQGANLAFEMGEENPWIKAADALVQQVPVIGMFSGYFLNPTYLIKRPNGTVVARLKKMPAFLEGKFALTQEAPLSDYEETVIYLSVLTAVLLERRRG